MSAKTSNIASSLGIVTPNHAAIASSLCEPQGFKGAKAQVDARTSL